VFVLTEGGRRHELAGEAVGELAADGRGGALAIVGGHSLYRRNSEGEWSCVATSELQLECSVAVGDVIYVGTEDAHLLRIHGSGEVERLAGFDAAPGRESCYAGSVLVDGRSTARSAAGDALDDRDFGRGRVACQRSRRGYFEVHGRQ